MALLSPKSDETLRLPNFLLRRDSLRQARFGVSSHKFLCDDFESLTFILVGLKVWDFFQHMPSSDGFSLRLIAESGVTNSELAIAAKIVQHADF